MKAATKVEGGLRNIQLRDFVIVHALNLDLSSGFTALTGETGAGKSILIDALQLVLGGRGDAGFVREGCDKTEISAEFDTPAEAHAWLQEGGFDDGDTLLLKRSVDAQGRSRAWINGSAATVAQLRELAEWLVDIHGQHAWQSLMRPAAVRELFDAYGHIDTAPMQHAWGDWKATERTLTEARDAQDRLHDERERMLWQLQDLRKLAPAVDEWDELNLNHQRLSSSQDLLGAAESAIADLDGGQGEEGVLSRLNSAIRHVTPLAHLDGELTNALELLQSSLAQAQEAQRTLSHSLRHVEPDPQALQKLDERLSQWLSLARRHKQAPEAMPTLLTDWEQRLVQLDQVSDVAALEAAAQRAQAQWLQAAKQVSKQRHATAPKLSDAVSSLMQDLGMQGGRFEVQLETLDAPHSSGLEQVQFAVAGHAGATPKPVGKVASGGELSRLSLALAVTTRQLASVPTLIFDEVDSGIGGAVADTVGRLMHRLGQSRQVLAVTHLPQVAARADHHLRVQKMTHGQGVSSSVVALDGGQRVGEIARMLGGDTLTDISLRHAQHMLNPEAPDMTVRITETAPSTHAGAPPTKKRGRP